MEYKAVTMCVTVEMTINLPPPTCMFIEKVNMFLTTVEWVGIKLTFLEKDICHDHEIDILRTLAKLQLRYVVKNVLFQQILILRYFP